MVQLISPMCISVSISVAVPYIDSLLTDMKTLFDMAVKFLVTFFHFQPSTVAMKKKDFLSVE